jgi:hypothetical protein
VVGRPPLARRRALWRCAPRNPLRGSVGNDLLVDNVVGSLNVTHTFGSGQTQTYMGAFGDALGKDSASYKNAAAVAGTETMTRNFSGNDNNDDLAVVAIKFSGSTAASTATTSVYAYAGTGYANPDAVTSIGNGLRSGSQCNGRSGLCLDRCWPHK